MAQKSSTYPPPSPKLYDTFLYVRYRTTMTETIFSKQKQFQTVNESIFQLKFRNRNPHHYKFILQVLQKLRYDTMP